jgi:predicted metal-binding protein
MRRQITRNKSKAKAGRQAVTLYVCRSCVWSEAEREQDGKRQGEFLLAAIKQILLRTPLLKNIGLRAVHCLSGCKSPCNVAFRSAGKFGLRFSHLTPDNAGDVLAFLGAYNDSDAGDVPEAEIPQSMRGNLTARTPPPPIRSK